jgi:uncharacterized protein (DUF1501 family)
MREGPHSRRQFLKAAAAVGLVTPVAGAFGLQLAAAGAAAGQTAPDYKALVCIFQLGGNDGHNTVLPTDADSWGRYWSARNTGVDPIALMPVGTAPVAVGATSPVTGRVARLNTPEAWGGVLPIVPLTPNPVPAGTNATSRTFGLHPMLAPLKDLFDQRRMAVIANVGTLIEPITKAEYRARTKRYPANLFSHNDQQSVWQAGQVEGVRTGWGGQFGDMLASMNGANSAFTAISTSGNAVFLSGRSVLQYQVSTGATPAVLINAAAGNSLFGSTAAPGIMRQLIEDTNNPHLLASDHAGVVVRSRATAAGLNAAVGAGSVAAGLRAPPTYTNPVTGNTETNSLSVQLQTVARMIAAGQSLGLRRQVFFVGMGGHDNHDVQNVAQPNNLAKLAQALATFDATLANIGGVDFRPNVTAFTASDFGRTFNTNGDGTDHAWGSHHFVVGGAVRGGDIYGQFPTIGVDLGSFNNPDMSSNSLIPTYSVDRFAATLGTWFGVGSSDLNTIFPNLRNFAAPATFFV